MTNFSENQRRDVEQVLLALFDAHGRVHQDLNHVIQKTEPNSDARERAMEARQRAAQQVALTAVDRIQKKFSKTIEYHEASLDFVEQSDSYDGLLQQLRDCEQGEYVRFYTVLDHEVTLVEGEVLSKNEQALQIDSVDRGEMTVFWTAILERDPALDDGDI